CRALGVIRTRYVSQPIRDVCTIYPVRHRREPSKAARCLRFHSPLRGGADDMNWKIERLGAAAVALVLAVGFAAPVSAQFYTGRIDVTLSDQTGGRLPGVNVDITGPVNQSQVTDTQGEAHFLNLPVGTYTVKAALSGFNPYTNTNVPVVSGGAVPLEVRLAVSVTAETVTVTAATPVIDVKKETTTTNVTLEELQNIPSARDPWVVVQTVPSIVVDRVNVG